MLAHSPNAYLFANSVLPLTATPYWRDMVFPYLVCRSSIQSSVLSDAATERGPSSPHHKPIDSLSSRRPRAPAALILPEPKQKLTLQKLRDKARAMKLGPGAYDAATVADTLLRRRSGVVPLLGPPSATACSRRRPDPPTPGPGAYSVSPVAQRESARQREPPPVAPWSRQTGRDPPKRKMANTGTSPSAIRSASATRAAALAPATVGGALGLEVRWETVKPRQPTVHFGSVPRNAPLAPPRAADGVPLYAPCRSLVEPRAIAAAIMPLPSASRRHVVDARAALAAAARIDALLRGNVGGGLPPAAPADALRGPPRGFRYVVGRTPSRRPVDRHPAVQPGPAPLLYPNWEILLPRVGSAYLGPGGAESSKSESRALPGAGDVFAPGPGAYEAATAFMLLCVRRAPAALISRPSSASTAALDRWRAMRCRYPEGDALRLEVLCALNFTRPSPPAAIRWLLPTTKPRKPLSLPPVRVPPLPPVDLLPRLHVSTPHFAPPRVKDELDIRMPAWGFVERPETFGWAAEALDLLVEQGRNATESRVIGGAWSVEERFGHLEAMASLLPEGCVLTLCPNDELTRPRHGIMVDMARSTTPRFFESSATPLGEGDMLLLRVERQLVEPTAPSIDFGRAAGRDDHRVGTTAMPHLLWLTPSFRLVEPRQDVSLVDMREGEVAARRRRRIERRTRARERAAPVHGGAILCDIEAALAARREIK